MEKHLHIICLNVPYPVDYGGVFDLFYKLPALQNLGIKIHLHCFEYGRGEQKVLNQYCESVKYYKRRTGVYSLSLQYPYIVSSRRNEELLLDLAKDNYPILMEGIHCTYLLNDERFKDRKCFVRLHNVEHIYYRHLYQNATAPFKKLFYKWESNHLKKYEQAIINKATFWGVIQKDVETYQKLGCKKVELLPLFLPPWEVEAKEGKGCFCLYQGDLSVGENNKAATWLLQEVFNDIEIPFVIAGKNPSKQLEDLIHLRPSTCLIANPGEKEMQDLLAKAQVNIIPSFNSTGIKLKLINALYNSRHCVVNEPTVEGTGLEKACYLADDAQSFKTAIIELFEQPLETEDIQLRRNLLGKMFDNKRNAEQMVKAIWE